MHPRLIDLLLHDYLMVDRIEALRCQQIRSNKSGCWLIESRTVSRDGMLIVLLEDEVARRNTLKVWQEIVR